MAGWTRADFGGGGGGSRAPDKAAAPRDSKAKVGKDVKGGKGKGGAGDSGGSLARIPDDIMLKVFISHNEVIKWFQKVNCPIKSSSYCLFSLS